MKGVPGGFGAVAVYQEIRDCLGISEPTGVRCPRAQTQPFVMFWFTGFFSGGSHLGKLCLVWVWGPEQLGAWPGSQVEAAALFWCFLSLWSGLRSPLCEMGA